MKAKAAQRVEVARAKTLAVALTGDMDGDPRELIMAQLRSRAAQVAWWRARVHDLAPGESADVLLRGTRGVSRTESESHGFESGTKTATTTDVGPLVHFALAQWGEAQDALEHLCLQAVKVGLDERRVRLEEQQQGVLVEGLRWLASEAATEYGWADLEKRAFDGILSEMLHRLDALEGQPAPAGR